MIDMEDFANKKSADLLKDKRFLLWRLAPTAELDGFWESVLERFPSLKGEIAGADVYLKNHLLKCQAPGVREKDHLLKGIARSCVRRHRARQSELRIWTRYAIAASLFLFVVSAAFFYLNRPKQSGMAPGQMIVGSRLTSKNIRLISGHESFDFEENVVIAIDNGIACVEQPDIRIKMGRDESNRVIVPFGKRCRMRLCDGTEIWLNSGSALEFPTEFKKEGRRVALAGEAYMEVAHRDDCPFYVHTDDFDLKVLGTKFNIAVCDHFPKLVALAEGCVELTENQSSCRLYPGEVAFYDAAGAFVKEKSDVAKYISWVNHYIVLENTPLTEVLRYIEHYYNYSFYFSNREEIERIACEGKLYLSDDLENVLTSIALLSNTVYTKEGDKIRISKK